MPQEENQEATVRSSEIEAIVNGYHGNPFAVLGPHEVDDGLAIRAFVGNLNRVEIIERNVCLNGCFPGDLFR